MARAAKKTSKSAPNRSAAKKSVRPLAAAIARAPQLADRKAAQARLAEWLAAIGKTSAGKALKQRIAGAPKVEALLLGDRLCLLSNRPARVVDEQPVAFGPDRGRAVLADPAFVRMKAAVLERVLAA